MCLEGDGAKLALLAEVVVAAVDGHRVAEALKELRHLLVAYVVDVRHTLCG